MTKLGMVVAIAGASAISACGGTGDVYGPLDGSEGSFESTASTKQAVNITWAKRGAAAVQVNRGAGNELWVLICDRATGQLQHRIKRVDGTWGSWFNDQQSCTAAPSAAVWPLSDQPEVPVAYYRNGNDLMETTWTSSNSSVTDNLSTGTSFGRLTSDLLADSQVTSFTTSTKQISLIAGRQSDGLLYSVDFTLVSGTTRWSAAT